MTTPAQLARALLDRCAVRPNECVFVLSDAGTVPELRQAVEQAVRDSGANLESRNDPNRDRPFAELPGSLLDELLSSGLVIDLTSQPWLYSDSFTRYGRECQAAGSRLALVLGDAAGYDTLLACPPDAGLFERAKAALPVIRRSPEITVRSPLGTWFTAELTGSASFIGEPPVAAGMIGAPFYASVTAPFAPRTASGTLVFTGCGRIQGPAATPFSTADLVTIRVDRGYVTGVEGDGELADRLRRWRAAAPTPEVDRIMDCNIGFDPRGNLAAADNQVVHCFSGGLMIGIGSPYEYQPEGSLKPDFHLDLLFTGVDVSFDGRLLIRNGALDQSLVRNEA